MKKTDRLEKKIKDFYNTHTEGVKTSPELDSRILSAAEQNLNKPTTFSVQAEPNVWRTIMKNKMTRWATLAIVLVSICFGLFLSNGSFDGASISYAQVSENMKKVPWLHGIIEGQYNGNSERLEAWFSFRYQMSLSKKSSGQIEHHNILEGVLQTYDPESNTVTISHAPTNDTMLFGSGSVWSFWETMMKQIEEADPEVIRDGDKNQMTSLYKIASGPSGTPMEVEITLNRHRSLPISLVQRVYDADGEITIEAMGVFDYPEDGPADIYALGVPESAKVIDLLPAEDVPEIMEAYRFHRNASPSDYIALVTDTWLDSKFNSFIQYRALLIYQNGTSQRVEEYILPKLERKAWTQTHLEFTETVGKTFESQLTWWRENGQISSVDLYDGKYQYRHKQEEAQWIAEPKKWLPFGSDYYGDNDLADFGWGEQFFSVFKGHSPFEIVKDDYSEKHNLICLESISQGNIVEEDRRKITWAVPPKKNRCYLSPDRDFICQRLERHASYDAPWQVDKTWSERINVDTIKKYTVHNLVREVVEFGQTSEGKWYPLEIKIWDPTDPDEGIRTKKVWLKTNPDFPDGIFEPENLPRSDN